MDFNSKYKSSEIEALLDKVASGNTGGGSGGSGAYPEVDGSRYGSAWSLGNYEIYDMQPNTFYVFPECVSLYIQFADETVGVANEYLFQFTSGATATSLTLPDDIKWANDSAPTIAENMIYQVSILKGLASVLEFSNIKFISFTIVNDAYIAEDGMTWQEWVNSSYNGGGYRISGGLVVWGTNYVGLNYSAVSLSSLIISNTNYEYYNNEPV